MADAKISALTTATPAGADLVPIVDVSDTTMGADGSTRKATVTSILSLLDTVTGTFKVQQAGGTPGTDEVQVSHDGTRGIIESKDGRLRLKAATDVVEMVNQAGDSIVRFQFSDATGGGVLQVSAYQIVLSSGSTVAGPSFTTDSSYSNFGTNAAAFGSDGQVTWTTNHPCFYGAAANVGVAAAAPRVVELNNGTKGGAGGTLRSVPLTVSLTATQHNWNPGVARFYAVTTDATRNITGLAIGQVDGQECWVLNVGSNDLTLDYEDVNSSAGNRFHTFTGTTATVPPGGCAHLVYDAAASVWRVWAEGQPGAAGPNAVSASTTTSYSGFLMGNGSYVTTGDPLPSQAGNSGMYLTTNGSAASWATVTSLAVGGSGNDLQVNNGSGGLGGITPSTGVLTWNGSSYTWATLPAPAGSTGDVQVNNGFGGFSNVPGWTGTFATGAGQTVTVTNGVITGVA